MGRCASHLAVPALEPADDRGPLPRPFQVTDRLGPEPPPRRERGESAEVVVAARRGRDHQRGAAVTVAGVDVCTFREEEAGEFHLAEHGRGVQGRAAVFVLGIRARPEASSAFIESVTEASPSTLVVK